MTIVTPEPTIERDRYKRPLVAPPGGGKKVAYTRCTTFVDVVEDKYNLQKWQQRMVAAGLAMRPDLLLSAQAHRDDKSEMDRICEAAREAAAASAAATTGTALHALTELIDRGQEMPVGLGADVEQSLEAYRVATADLKPVFIEKFCVLDTLKIGGTPDRVVEFGGERYIADVKTGGIEFGALKIAMQLAVYSRSWVYDIASGAREAHGASTTRGIVIHLPAGTGECTLHWIDLEAGWDAVQVASQVRTQRKVKFPDLTEPFGKPARDSLHAQKRDESRQAARNAADVEQLKQSIAACSTAEQVRSLWTPDWSDELNAVATAHIASLPTVA